MMDLKKISSKLFNTLVPRRKGRITYVGFIIQFNFFKYNNYIDTHILPTLTLKQINSSRRNIIFYTPMSKCSMGPKPSCACNSSNFYYTKLCNTINIIFFIIHHLQLLSINYRNLIVMSCEHTTDFHPPMIQCNYNINYTHRR